MGGNADIDILPDDYGMLDIGMRFLDRKLVLRGKARYVGEATYATVSWVNDTPDLSTIPAHTIIDLYGSYDFNKSTQLFFCVQNLGNKVYAAPVSGDGILLAGRGRTFIVGLTSRIGARGTQSEDGSNFIDLFRPSETPHDWSGFYVGANAGYSGSTNKNGMAFTSESGTTYNLNRNLDLQATLGGLYGGYNKQFSNGVVTGVDTDINLLRASARTGTFTTYQTNFNSRRAELETRQEWSAALRARLSYSVPSRCLGWCFRCRIRSQATL